MRNLLFLIIMAVTVHVPSNLFAAQPRHDVICLVDISDSPLHVTSHAFAQKAADWIDQNVMSSLEMGARIEIRSFGEMDLEKNALSLKWDLMNKQGYRPAEVTPLVKKIIAAIPTLVAKGKLKIQRETNLIGALRIYGQRHIPSRKTTIVILSDMLEWSSDADAYKLVVRKGASLPKAPADILKGARVIALGAGHGLRASTRVGRLQAMWTKWLKQAGVDEFFFYTDF